MNAFTKATTGSLFRTLLFLWCMFLPLLFTATTTRGELRVWESQSGETLEAKPLAMHQEWVLMEQESSERLEVPLHIFSQEDQKRLINRFLTAGGAGEFHVPVGEISGPISSGECSYLIYIPKSMRIDRSAPLLYFTLASGGRARRMRRLLEGAELTGWVVVCSIESENGLQREEYHKQFTENMEHVRQHLQIDMDRLYFSGNSGGARVGFLHARNYNGAGVLAVIAGSPQPLPSTRGHYYFLTGARDYNHSCRLKTLTTCITS